MKRNQECIPTKRGQMRSVSDGSQPVPQLLEDPCPEGELVVLELVAAGLEFQTIRIGQAQRRLVFHERGLEIHDLVVLAMREEHALVVWGIPSLCSCKTIDGVSSFLRHYST